MIHSIQAGDLQKAQTIHHGFNDYYKLLFVDGNPSGVKCTLALQGTIKNVLRLPLVPARKETEAKIAEFLKS